MNLLRSIIMKKTAIALAIALGAMSGTASALTINDIQNLIGPDPYRWEDNDIEKLGKDVNENGLLDVGDTLLSIIEIEKIINENTGDEYDVAPGPGNGPSLAGIAEIKVISRIDIAPGIANFVFGAPLADGVMITFYEDTVDDVNITNCGANTAACLGTVTNGTKILELGFNGSLGENWAATGPVDPNLVDELTTTEIGGFNFGVTVLTSSIDLINVGDYWNGSGSLQGCTTTTGTVIRSCSEGGFTSTSDFQLAPGTIPEPGSLSLLGLGLVGLAGLCRRKSV
jgi:hypothetical protein